MNLGNEQLKFLFVGVMLALVLIGRTDRNHPQTVKRENSKNNIFASVQPLVPAARTDKSPVLPTENLIYRKDWNSPEPNLKVKAALAKNLNSNFDFYSLNRDTRWPLASLTKLMTAVIALEKIGKDKIITISASAVVAEGPAGNLEVGEQYIIADLLKALLVVSSNDAAEAIAESYGRDNFIEEMQKKAVVLKMANTTFADPSGLSSVNQSTITDLEKIFLHVYENQPEILDITKQEKVFIDELTKNIQKELNNINNFVHRPDFLGGKTGFTDEASGNLISLFDYRGHKLLTIVFGTDDRFGQTEILYNWVINAYAF